MPTWPTNGGPHALSPTATRVVKSTVAAPRRNVVLSGHNLASYRGWKVSIRSLAGSTHTHSHAAEREVWPRQAARGCPGRPSPLQQEPRARRRPKRQAPSAPPSGSRAVPARDRGTVPASVSPAGHDERSDACYEESVHERNSPRSGTGTKTAIRTCRWSRVRWPMRARLLPGRESRASPHSTSPGSVAGLGSSSGRVRADRARVPFQWWCRFE